MLGRQRLTGHPDGDHRLSSGRHRPVGREADGEPIDGPADDLGRARLDAGRSKQLLEPDARPQCVADEMLADLVADAGDRHVLLDERHVEQVVIG